MPIDALSVLCAQLTRDLLAIAKFLLYLYSLTAFVRFLLKKLLACLLSCSVRIKRTTRFGKNMRILTYFRMGINVRNNYAREYQHTTQLDDLVRQYY